ncbi:MAG TPA: DnaJ domain-containing protein [Thermoanaerobaculia bacterium]|nr:DnaJ domain-containing protein [Thermoanaerobaculia bacterium]
MTNYYDVLGVARDASESEIRTKFRILARENHPDRFTEPEKKRGAEERFQLLTEAMNVLTSESRRKVHDTELEKNRPISQDPAAQARVFLAKGVKSYREGNFPDAITQFELAVHHFDRDAKAFHYLALASMKVVGQVRKGVDAIEAAIKLDANNALFHRDAGKLYIMAGLNSKAERHLEEALTWLPEDPETLSLLMKVRPNKQTSGVRKTPSGIFGRKG